MPSRTCSECGKEIIGDYATLRMRNDDQVTELDGVFCIGCAIVIQYINIQQRNESVELDRPTIPFLLMPPHAN